MKIEVLQIFGSWGQEMDLNWNLNSYYASSEHADLSFLDNASIEMINNTTLKTELILPEPENHELKVSFTLTHFQAFIHTDWLYWGTNNSSILSLLKAHQTTSLGTQ